MKTLAITLGAMAFAASATAADIYGGFGADPDLAVWQERGGDAVGVQPGIGDVSSTHRSGTVGSGLFKGSAPGVASGDSMERDRANIYGGFAGADLPSGF